jgi:hypothetical protein
MDIHLLSYSETGGALTLSSPQHFVCFSLVILDLRSETLLASAMCLASHPLDELNILKICFAFK